MKLDTSILIIAALGAAGVGIAFLLLKNQPSIRITGDNAHIGDNYFAPVQPKSPESKSEPWRPIPHTIDGSNRVTSYVPGGY